ncbi:MAG: hypothetical protein P1Q69_05055 [Candidatus Thorarchaeota archaeon]|nr:hypothetical protein [Candidatus Thorarchaeota archaeon]
MNDDDLKRLEQNAFRDSMKDGSTELLGGVLLLFAPIMFYQPAFVAFFALFFIFLLPHGIERFRQKYTYPRIGYVKLRTSESDTDPKPFLLLLVICFLVTGIATFLFTGDIFNIYNWIPMFPLFFGVLMFGPSAYLVEKARSKAYWLFGLITSIAGFIIFYLTTIFPPTDVYAGIIVFSMFLGIALVIGGAVKFLHFTRTYPILESEEDDASE